MPQMKLQLSGKNAGDFSKAGRLIIEYANKVSLDFLYYTYEDLVDATPVCTGYAAANWYVTKGFPKLKGEHGEREYHDVCEIEYEPFEWQGDPYRYNSPNQKGAYWYISNTADYMVRLNHGSSAKAPAGFVQGVVYKNIGKANGMNFI